MIKSVNINKQNIKFSNNKGQFLTLNKSTDNCKFGTLENLNCASRDLKNLVDTVLKTEKSMRVLMAHVNQKSLVEKLKKDFEIISVLELPIGYNIGKQYHVHIRNTYDETYKQRFIREGAKSSLNSMLDVNTKILMETFKAGKADKTYHTTNGFKKFIKKNNYGTM